MQTCYLCNAQSPDDAIYCHECNADLRVFSTANFALKKFQENPRIRDIRLVVADDACPVCSAHEGTYPKDRVPKLPIQGCSHPNGCRCFYEPSIQELFP